MKKKQIGFGILALIIPIFVLGIIMGVTNLWPFGEDSMLIWDMEIQYVHIYNWYHDVLHGEASIFYDFSKSLGGNMYGIFTTYLASPINLLAYFFEADKTVYFITLATIVKIALSGLSCYIYLIKRIRCKEYLALFFSVSYALMEYNIGLCSNLHFLDAIYMLPIVALGVYYLVEDNKKILLMASVAYTVFCNWYIGYMVCAFVSFYFVFEWTISERSKSIKAFLQCFVRYIGAVMVGLLISSVTFFPSVLASLNGKGEVSFSYLKPDFHCNIFEPLKAFFVTSQANSSYEEPAIYVGGFVLTVILVGIFDKRISLKKKILAIVFIAFVLLSFSFVPLEVVWTAFKKTYSFHFRYSFVFSFLLILVAGLFVQEMEQHKSDVKFRKCVIVFATIFLVTVGILRVSQNARNVNVDIFYLLFLMIYVCLILSVDKYRKKSFKVFIIGSMGILLLMELGYNATLAFRRYGVTNYEYSEYMDTVSDKIDNIVNEDGSFYRMEKTFSERDLRAGSTRAAATEGLTFNYNCLTHYSSLYDATVNDFLVNVGYCKKDAMLTNYVEPNPVMDSMLGIKYILTDKECSLLEKVDEFSCNVNENISVYKNENALSFATKIVENEVDETWSNNPIENQSRILRAMLGRGSGIFLKQEYEEIYNGVWKITVSEAGPIYAYFCIGHEEREVWVNGDYKQNYFGRFHKNILYLGEYEEGDVIQIELKGDTECEVDHLFCAYTVDKNAYAESFSELRKNSVSSDINEDDYIELTWNATEEETILIAIPYDEGWQIYVNDEEVSYEKAYQTFICLNVSSGENKIVMKYTPPYLNISIIATITGMFLVLVVGLLEKRRKI